MSMRKLKLNLIAHEHKNAYHVATSESCVYLTGGGSDANLRVKRVVKWLQQY